MTKYKLPFRASFGLISFFILIIKFFATSEILAAQEPPLLQGVAGKVFFELKFDQKSSQGEITLYTSEIQSSKTAKNAEIANNNKPIALDKMSVEIIENPLRLVIDLLGYSGSKNQSFTSKNNETIKSLRTGTHPDKTRLVVDFNDTNIHSKKADIRVEKELVDNRTIIKFNLLKKEQQPLASPDNSAKKLLEMSYPTPLQQESIATSIENTKNSETKLSSETAKKDSTPLAGNSNITPTIALSNTAIANIATIVAPTPTNTSLSKQHQTTPKTSIATLTATPTITASITATKLTTSTATATPIATSNTPQTVPPSTPNQQLNITPQPTQIETAIASATATKSQEIGQISFEYQQPDNLPLIKIRLSQKPVYKLAKHDDGVFLLSVQNCQIPQKSLTLPQFPPEDFVGFRFIRASVPNKACEISIGVDKGTRIAAFVKDYDILVRSIGFNQ